MVSFDRFDLLNKLPGKMSFQTIMGSMDTKTKPIGYHMLNFINLWNLTFSSFYSAYSNILPTTYIFSTLLTYQHLLSGLHISCHKLSKHNNVHLKWRRIAKYQKLWYTDCHYMFIFEKLINLKNYTYKVSISLGGELNDHFHDHFNLEWTHTKNQKTHQHPSFCFTQKNNQICLFNCTYAFAC